MILIITGRIGGIIAGIYSDRIKKRYLVIQVLLLVALPCVYAIFLVPVNISLIFLIISGLFSISTLPLCTRLMQDLFPRNIGLASSLSIGVAAGSAAASLMVVGKIADNIGMVTTIRYVILFPLLGALLLFLFPVFLKRSGLDNK